MTLKALPLALLFVACAPVNFARRPYSDIPCGPPVGPVSVYIARGVWGLSCKEARETVRRTGVALAGVSPGWEVVFTDGFAGFDVDRNGRAYTPKGVTYPAERRIVVEATASAAVVAHELGHASDFDNGRPNTRD